MSHFIFWTAVGFLIAVVFASFFEWALHRFVMHRPVGKLFTYPFERHALVHHHVFKADHTYHLINDEDKHTIPMAWWNGPMIILVGAIPFTIVCWLPGKWGIVAGSTLACTVYSGAYEYMHW